MSLVFVYSILTQDGTKHARTNSALIANCREESRMHHYLMPRLRTIPYSSRHLHPLTLLDHQSKTNSFSASFFPSTCKAWNNLNYDVVSVSTFSSFKNLTKPKQFFLFFPIPSLGCTPLY